MEFWLAHCISSSNLLPQIPEFSTYLTWVATPLMSVNYLKLNIIDQTPGGSHPPSQPNSSTVSFITLDGDSIIPISEQKPYVILTLSFS